MRDTDPEEQTFSHKKIRPSSPGPITNKKRRPWKGIWLVLRSSNRRSFCSSALSCS